MQIQAVFRVLRKRAKRVFAPSQNFAGFLVSFPKSGRTWLRVIFDDLNVPLDYKHDGAKHSIPVPFEELALCGKRFAEKPVIFMCRDPRDTAISGYFQKTLRRDGYAGTISDFLRDPLHGVEKIVRYNLTWLERGSQLPAFLPITYEETTANAVAVVRRSVAFLGLDIPEQEIERVVADNTFSKMQKREATGEYRERYSDTLTPADPADTDSYKVRRGKVGGYKDYLSAEDQAYCDEVLQRHSYFDRLNEFLMHNTSRGQNNAQPSRSARKELA